ncbi:mitochondrial import receptor subunit TOM40-1 isoform X2 [Helianthus annuus]|uniref:mitochondrial import receptor subunit TOM40-1 isoform X2 n=1 Tax=Helianthus annuus TaxID=4232 RepID=UPI000B8F6CAB|nr:mitochondrial import receptor subunit TOM40-1 isoform X2 [Helianthus annuus]
MIGTTSANFRQSEPLEPLSTRETAKSSSLHVSLNVEHFEGMRVDFTKFLNQRFSLTHSTLMGPTEIPSQYAEIIKIPTAHYAFGANFMHPKLMLFGRVLTDGQVNSGIKWDSSDNLSMNVDAQMPSLLEKQCTCKYILQKMDGPNVLQRQAMLDGLHKFGMEFRPIDSTLRYY